MKVIRSGFLERPPMTLGDGGSHSLGGAHMGVIRPFPGETLQVSAILRPTDCEAYNFREFSLEGRPKLEPQGLI